MIKDREYNSITNDAIQSLLSSIWMTIVLPWPLIIISYLKSLPLSSTSYLEQFVDITDPAAFFNLTSLGFCLFGCYSVFKFIRLRPIFYRYNSMYSRFFYLKMCTCLFIFIMWSGLVFLKSYNIRFTVDSSSNNAYKTLLELETYQPIYILGFTMIFWNMHIYIESRGSHICRVRVPSEPNPVVPSEKEEMSKKD